MHFRTLLLISILVLPPHISAQEEELPEDTPAPALLDFDGDGISDLAVHDDQQDGSPNELVYSIRQSSTGEVLRYEFGGSDHIRALGDYDGDGMTDLVVVKTEEDDSLTWRTSRNAEITEFSFGVVGDTVLSGCDFNGDTVADPAILSNTGIIRFRTSEETAEEFTISLPEGGTPTHFSCGDGNGDGEIEFAMIFQSSEGSSLHFFALDGSEISQSLVTSPRDLFQYENGFAVFSKLKNRAFLDHFRFATPETIERSRIRLRGSKKAHFATTVYDSERDIWTLLFYGKSGSFFTRSEPSGRVLRSELEKISGEGLLQPHNLGTTAPPANEDPNSLCSTIEEMRDGPGGRLWKQSDHTGVVALFTPRDGYTAKRVRVMYQGVITEELEFSGLGNPDPEGLRTHWRNRYKNASEFPPGIVLVVTANGGQTFCYRIDKPGQRVD